jgi:hypothetical protein
MAGMGAITGSKNVESCAFAAESGMPVRETEYAPAISFSHRLQRYGQRLQPSNFWPHSPMDRRGTDDSSTIAVVWRLKTFSP